MMPIRLFERIQDICASVKSSSSSVGYNQEQKRFKTGLKLKPVLNLPPIFFLRAIPKLDF